MDQIVVGLDIGTTKVCAVVGKLNEYGKVNILGLGRSACEGVRRGDVVNIERTVEAIKDAVAEAEQKSNINIKTVHVGIGGEHIRCIRKNGVITLNDSQQEIHRDDLNRLHNEMRRVVTEPGMEIIHVLPQEYTVDNHVGVKDPIGMSGVRLEGVFLIITAQKNSIQNIENCLRRAGLKTKEIILQPLASSFATLSAEEKEAGVCLVDIGGGTTDVAIFHESVIRHTAVIPIGGQIITEDVKSGCSILPKAAEKLKIEYGAAYAFDEMEDEIISIPGLNGRPPKEIRKKTLVRIIQARMEELMEFVLMEIEESGYMNKLQGGIIITGGGALLHHLASLTEYVTGFDTQIRTPGEHLAKGMIEEVKNPTYATAVGLVNYGLLHPTFEPTGERPLNPQRPTPVISELEGLTPQSGGVWTKLKDSVVKGIENFTKFVD